MQIYYFPGGGMYYYFVLNLGHWGNFGLLFFDFFNNYKLLGVELISSKVKYLNYKLQDLVLYYHICLILLFNSTKSSFWDL